MGNIGWSLERSNLTILYQHWNNLILNSSIKSHLIHCFQSRIFTFTNKKKLLGILTCTNEFQRISYLFVAENWSELNFLKRRKSYWNFAILQQFTHFLVYSNLSFFACTDSLKYVSSMISLFDHNFAQVKVT